MSFFRLNEANPSSKRPFRLKDLQDLWESICSLFNAVPNESFRIVSGFSLENGVYTKGVVFYEGQLYEYDGTSITPNTPSVEFVREPQDDRTIEGGDTQPFSYRYICRGVSVVSGNSTFDSFKNNIEEYKTYVGDSTITTQKIADAAVTNDKLSFGIRRVSLSGDRADFIQAASGTSFDLEDLYIEGKSATKRISIDASTPWGITLVGNEGQALPNEMPVMVVNPSPHSGTVYFRLNDPSGNEDVAEYSTNMSERSVKIFRFLTDTQGRCYLERL